MSLFNTKTLEIRDFSAGSINANGRWVDGITGEKKYIQCSEQPSSGQKVVVLLEGKRVTSIIDIYTASDLTIADPKTLQGGTQIKIRDEWYNIIAKESWQNGIINHYEYTVVRERELL